MQLELSNSLFSTLQRSSGISRERPKLSAGNSKWLKALRKIKSPNKPYYNLNFLEFFELSIRPAHYHCGSTTL